MGTLIDTSVVIEIERGRLDFPEDEGIGVATITVAELLHGVERADRKHRPARESFVEELIATVEVIPFDQVAARTYARLFASLRGTARWPGVHDLLVAATAVSLNWSLATLNVRDFAGVPGVRLR